MRIFTRNSSLTRANTYSSANCFIQLSTRRTANANSVVFSSGTELDYDKFVEIDLYYAKNSRTILLLADTEFTHRVSSSCRSWTVYFLYDFNRYSVERNLAGFRKKKTINFPFLYHYYWWSLISLLLYTSTRCVIIIITQKLLRLPFMTVMVIVYFIGIYILM